MECEVFISFSIADIDSARELASMLREMGFRPYMFEDYNRYSSTGRWLTDLTGAIDKVKVLVCLLTWHAVDSKWVALELKAAIDQGVDIIPLRLGDVVLPREIQLMLGLDTIRDVTSDLQCERVFLSQRIQDAIIKHDEKTSLETQFRKPVPVAPSDASLLGKRRGAEPYPGPRPFTEDQIELFHGRRAESEAIVRILRDTDILVLHGDSGVGKSSLLNAKVAPSIEQSLARQVLPSGRGGAAVRVNLYALPKPFENSNNQFVYSVIRCLGGDESTAISASLAEYLGNMARVPARDGRVLVLDQFEEIFFDLQARSDGQRGEFIVDLRRAVHEAGGGLKIIISFRKEYLADVERLLRPVKSDIRIATYALDPMTEIGMREAITEPVRRYLRFDTNVVDGLIRQLREVRIVRQDGRVEVRSGSRIEMVHLQIVCARLWESLPDGTVQVSEQDVERAAGEGRSVEEFVGDALNAFYEREVASAARVCGIPHQVVVFGCQRFVSPDGARLTLESGRGRVGRLSVTLADELSRRYFLRKDPRAENAFYEISHDLLVNPVRSARDAESADLLYATDMLERVLQRELGRNAGSLQHYFGAEEGLLEQCSVLAVHPSLFDDELELLLRISLKTGRDVEAWCRRAQLDASEMLNRVIQEAVDSSDSRLRRHAVRGICRASLESWIHMVVRMSVEDSSRRVRAVCAYELYLSNRRGAMEVLVEEMRHGAKRAVAVGALATMKTYSSQSHRSHTFHTVFDTLRGAERMEIRVRSWFDRLETSWWSIGLVFAMTVLFVVPPASAFKMLPAHYDWGVSQHEPSALIGAFQGLVAGVFWGGLTTACIAFYYYVFSSEKHRGSGLDLAWTIVFALIGALLGSGLISFAVLGVFNEQSLNMMGWIRPDQSGIDRLSEAFVETRFGWVNFAIGGALGIGFALVVHAIRIDPGWLSIFHSSGARAESFGELWGITLRLARIALPKMGYLVAIMLLGVVASLYIPDTTTFAEEKTKANLESLIKGLLGDVSTQIIGAYFSIVGMLVAMIVVRHGIEIDPILTMEEDGASQVINSTGASIS